MISKAMRPPESRPQVLLWGARSTARIAQAMVLEADLGDVVLIFDETLAKPGFRSRATFLPSAGALRRELHRVSHFVVCIGAEHGWARHETGRALEALGLRPLPLIHPRSFVDPSAKLGPACQVMPGAIVHKFARVGAHAILNTGCVVDHECVLGKGVHVMGSAAVAGRVRIGDFATIGTNATILPDLRIGRGALVGAGAVVTENVRPYGVVVGVPARWRRSQELQFRGHTLAELAGSAFGRKSK